MKGWSMNDIENTRERRALSIIMLLWAVAVKIFGLSVQGWSSTLCSIWFIGGLQTLCLGIIGEYVGKIYAEVKQRPRYHIETFLHGDVQDKTSKVTD